MGSFLTVAKTYLPLCPDLCRQSRGLNIGRRGVFFHFRRSPVFMLDLSTSTYLEELLGSWTRLTRDSFFLLFFQEEMSLLPFTPFRESRV